MFKRFVGVIALSALALLGGASAAVADPPGDHNHHRANHHRTDLRIKDVDVDRHGDLDVAFKEEGLDHGDEARVIGVAKFICVKHHHGIEIGRSFDSTRGETDEHGDFEGDLELDLRSHHCKKVIWKNLFVKDVKSGASDFERGPWVRRLHHDHEHGDEHRVA